MNLTEHSDLKIQATFDQWEVDGEYSQVMYNYLVYGFYPGSFFTSILANDFVGAMNHSHPANTISALRRLVGWIQDYMPAMAWGSYDAVKAWVDLDSSGRRQILEEHKLIFTEKEETWRVLNDA
jgi:hypothetical protein